MPAVLHEHQHPLAVELTKVVGLYAVLAPGPQEPAPAGGHLPVPSPDAFFGPVGNHELDLGMRPLARAEVAAFPVGIDRAHEVEVLGHRQGSIAPIRFAGRPWT